MEAVRFESRHPGELTGLRIVARLGFGRRDVSDRLEAAPVVEPVDPFEGCELDGLKTAPGSSAADHFRLEEADDALGEGVVIGVAHATDRRLDPGFGQALAVLDRDILGGLPRGYMTTEAADVVALPKLKSMRVTSEGGGSVVAFNTEWTSE